MPGAIVVIVVESPAPTAPVRVALETLGALSLGGDAPIATDTSICGLEPDGPWEMGNWIDIDHDALPATRRRHRVSYVDPGDGFAVFRVNIRYDGDKNRVPQAVSEAAVRLAREWIEERRPAAVYITGPKGSPAESAMASPSELTEVTWWTWVPNRAVESGGDGVVSDFADGVIVQVAEEFHSKVKLPDSVGPALGLGAPPRLRVGL